MTYWMYGVGFVALVLIISAIKASLYMRLTMVVGLVAALFYFTRKRR